MNLQGLTAIITGGGTGMGAAAAQALSAVGVRCALLGRRIEVLEETAAAVSGYAIGCDVADPQSVADAFEQVTERGEPARILVHAAAMGGMRPLLDGSGEPADLQAVQEIVNTNVLGTLYVNRAFAARLARMEMLEEAVRGVIINVSSIGALDGVVGSTYVASKAAVNGLCLSLARELSDWAIRVVTVAPGGIDTPMFRDGANAASYEMMRTMVPGLGRLGTPEEFGGLVRHVCENDYLNGCILRLDGGMRVPFARNVGRESEVLDPKDGGTIA